MDQFSSFSIVIRQESEIKPAMEYLLASGFRSVHEDDLNTAEMLMYYISKYKKFLNRYSEVQNEDKNNLGWCSHSDWIFCFKAYVNHGHNKGFFQELSWLDRDYSSYTLPTIEVPEINEEEKMLIPFGWCPYVAFDENSHVCYYNNDIPWLT